ncbi:MAG: cysteine desulfurase [Oscillospiraceae bacterium]|nr:cysteine desulfurase [Oscillospiraceae bacterium]
MIYLDNAATTWPDPQVVATITETLTTYSGNPSSLNKAGRDAARILSASRETIATALGSGGAVSFTSGGTESMNWALCGALHLRRHKGRHIITTAIEHDAVLAHLRDLADYDYEITYLQADKSGQISIDALSAALREDTALVSVMLVNNETGAILPVREMAARIRERSDALFHTDAVQAFCKIPFKAADLGVDLLSVSAHKLHGPKGIGALWVRDGLKLLPLLRGGGQESGLRSGTEALHNIAGFAKAVELAQADFPETAAHLETLQTHLRARLPAAVPSVRFLPQGAPHIVSLSLPGFKSEVVMNFLDSRGIAVSHASACKRGGRSHVLSVMGLPNEIIDGTIRVSFSRHTTVHELDQLIEGLCEATATLFPSL